jgi:hypothetical protein
MLDNIPRLTERGLARAFNNLRLAGYLKLGDVAELLARHPPTQAANRLRHRLAYPGRAPTRSEFEDAFLPFPERYDLPEPEINARVAGHEVDVYFRDYQLVIELDGYETHGTRDQFESDRDRDADLLACAIATVRLTWERFSLTPAREAARLHAIIRNRR